MKRIVVVSSAKADILKAAAYYEAQKEGLGERFLDHIQEAINRIALNPEGYAKVIGEARKSDIHRIQSSLFSKLDDDVLVIGCLHHRRDKVLARERASGVFPMPDPDPQ